MVEVGGVRKAWGGGGGVQTYPYHLIVDTTKHPPVLLRLVVVSGSVVGRGCRLEAAPGWWRWVGGV